jgi:hypothetical protein
MNKIKKYFTEKPEGNIWKRATIYLILLRFVGPLTLFLSIPLLLGLLAPNQTMVFEDMGATLANSFTMVCEKMYDVGSTIANNNPIISKIMVFAFSNIIWLIYVGIGYLIIDIIRHITSWVYNKRFAKGRNHDE